MAMSDSCGDMLKYTFGFFNLLLFVFGVVLLGLGTYAMTGDATKINAAIGTDLYKGTAIVLIASGVVIAAVSFLGCCGALSENRCLLTVFFCLVLVLFVLCGAGVITGFVLGSEKVLNEVEHAMQSTFNEYEDNKAAKGAWNVMQAYFHCCGMESGRDYKAFFSRYQVPESCCRLDDGNNPLPCEDEPNASNSYTDTGCRGSVREFIAHKGKLFGSVFIGVVVFLFVSMVLSCAIRSSIIA